MEAQAIDKLKSFLCKVQALTDTEWNDFASVWQPFAAKRKTILTAEGET